MQKESLIEREIYLVGLFYFWKNYQVKVASKYEKESKLGIVNTIKLSPYFWGNRWDFPKAILFILKFFKSWVNFT